MQTAMMKPFLLLVLSLMLAVANAQRFLRDGFTSSMDEEFKYETGDLGGPSPAGMPREMFVLQGLDLQLSPPSSMEVVVSPAAANPGLLAKQLREYLGKGPLALRLEQRRGGKGYRAFGITPDGRRLRGSWRRASPQSANAPLLNEDFLRVSYDEAVRSRATVVEIELLLPRAAGQKAIPRVVYQVAVEGGVMNPKAVIPRADGLVRVYPDKKDESTCCTIGPAKIGLRMKSGIVDPHWARGRTILRKGRSTGLI